MKTITGTGYSRSTAADSSYYTYLKPGALARLRDSKITAKSREIAKEAVLALIQSSSSVFNQPSLPDLSMDGVPCFPLRSPKYPRCLQRKKLVAVRPLFSEAQ